MPKPMMFIELTPKQFAALSTCKPKGECVACLGEMDRYRISAPDPMVDYCEERHQMMHDNGYKVGLVDDSVPMLPWGPEA